MIEPHIKRSPGVDVRVSREAFAEIVLAADSYSSGQIGFSEYCLRLRQLGLPVDSMFGNLTRLIVDAAYRRPSVLTQFP